MNKQAKSASNFAPRRMSAEEFRTWLACMECSDAAAARALGVSKATIVTYKRCGAPASIRMSCRLLYPKQSEAVFPWEQAA